MSDTTQIPTDQVTVFQLDGQPVRGRAVKLGPALDTALRPGGNSRYPEPIARLLGEAMMTGALVAQSLKFDVAGYITMDWRGWYCCDRHGRTPHAKGWGYAAFPFGKFGYGRENSASRR